MSLFVNIFAGVEIRNAFISKTKHFPLHFYVPALAVYMVQMVWEDSASCSLVLVNKYQLSPGRLMLGEEMMFMVTIDCSSCQM